jgi:hypothetical protein
MASQLPRSGGSARPAHRRRPDKTVRLRCEHLEDRVTPANLFNVQNPISPSGLNNNGFVAVTDLNKDGNADVILTNEGTAFTPSGDSNLVVLYGHGNGTFTRATFPTGAENVSYAAVGDINGDGYPDVVTVSENNAGDQSSTNQGILTVFKNDGSGNLVKVFQQSTDSINPSWVGLADVTGDGVLDVVVGAFGPDDQTGQSVDGKITIFQGLTDGSGHGNFNFSPNPITVIQPDQTFIPTALAVGDFDGDGNMDIAAAVPQAPSAVGQVPPDGLVDIFKGTGAGGFSAQPVAQYDSGGINPVNLQLADVTGDGKADLIVSNTGDASILTSNPDGQPLWYQDGVEVLPNTSTLGNPTFGVANSVVLTANLYGSFDTAVGDFNMDGKPDIAVVNYGSSQSATPTPATVAIFQGNGNGTFAATTPGTYPVGTKANNQPVLGGQYLAVGDFDNNHTPDLIVATADNYESLYTNNPALSSSAGLLLNALPPPPTVAGVQVNDGSAQRSQVRSIQVTFSTGVTFAGTGTVNANAAAAFQLTHLTNGINVGLTANVTANGTGQTVVTLSFSGSEIDSATATNPAGTSLADGLYSLTILSSKVSAGGEVLNGGGPNGNYVSPSDTGGNGLKLYRLYGDINGDGVINAFDFSQFRLAYGSSSADLAYMALFDLDGNGAINAFDFAQFRTRYGSSVFS